MMRRNREREKGVSALEFALAMPILFVVLFATVEFGLAFWRKQLLTAAVREGARAGIVMTSPRVSKDTITTKVKTYLDNVGLTDSSRSADCSNCPCAASGNSMTVTATYPSSMTVLSKLTSLFWGTSAVAANKTLTASITMQCE